VGAAVVRARRARRLWVQGLEFGCIVNDGE
jgi:hypothetical protein